MNKLVLYIFLFMAFPAMLWAQPVPKDDSARTEKGPLILPIVVRDNDTLPVYVMKDARVEKKISEEMALKQKEWNRLLYNLRKVWPYAQACAATIREIEQELDEKDRRKDQKRYLRAKEDSLRDEFTEKLKDLTQSQGALLIKLVSRQTGHTAFYLIKEYKNGLSAFFWNSFASVYGMSLKDHYDPEKESEIEAAIRELGYE